MKQLLPTRLSAVARLSAPALVIKYALRIAAVLTVGVLFSACDRDRDNDVKPSQTTAEVRLINRIDSLWTASMRCTNAPGLSVVVIKNGRTFFQKNYGYADLRTRTPVTNDTRFAIGSTTKAMTALAVLSLVDRGLVQLNEKVTTYLPDFRMRDPRYRDIRVKQLLSHSSGLMSFTQLTPPDNSAGALEGILPILAQDELDFAPGSGFYYSNYGATLAGLLVQRVTRMPYEAYMRQFLFDKVEMPNTTMEYWRPDALRGTKGYSLNAQNQPIETPPYFNRLYAPAGCTTITTSDDVARYLTMLVGGATTARGEKLLSDSLLTRLFAGAVNTDDDDFVQYLGAQGGTYAFGWQLINRNGYVTIEHGGNTIGMMSYFVIDPRTKSAVGILANEDGFPKANVAAEVARLVFTAN